MFVWILCKRIIGFVDCVVYFIIIWLCKMYETNRVLFDRKSIFAKKLSVEWCKCVKMY